MIFINCEFDFIKVLNNNYSNSVQTILLFEFSYYQNRFFNMKSTLINLCHACVNCNRKQDLFTMLHIIIKMFFLGMNWSEISISSHQSQDVCVHVRDADQSNYQKKICIIFPIIRSVVDKFPAFLGGSMSKGSGSAPGIVADPNPWYMWWSDPVLSSTIHTWLTDITIHNLILTKN